MNNILKSILFKVVLLVIVLHAIIPHPHSNELSDTKHFEIHQNTNSLIGLIRIVFHESNDENLDNLVIYQDEVVNPLNHNTENPNISVLNNTQFKIVQGKSGQAIHVAADDFSKNPFVKLNRLRGPPLLA